MDGILLFDKPVFWTSHDAVDFVRRRIGQKSVGHAGTLDPMATGLLVMLLGKATKLSQELMGLDKDYCGAMTLGVSTDTYDLDGRITRERDCSEVTAGAVAEIFEVLKGPQLQIPPSYSAIRKNGERLYDLARKGVVAEVEPRSIVVTELRMTDFSLPDVFFFLSCSKGTYVRSICDLVGERLGCGAALSSLVRTRVGKMSLEKAVNETQMRQWPLPEIEKHLIGQFGKDENIPRIRRPVP